MPVRPKTGVGHRGRNTPLSYSETGNSETKTPSRFVSPYSGTKPAYLVAFLARCVSFESVTNGAHYWAGRDDN
jgi:hypothetical protein